MGVGRSRAKVFDEERPTTTFADVAGYEGAKSEISEVVDFLQQPGPVHPGGRDGAPRRPDGRAARYRQDAAGPRGGGRGGRAVLLGDGLQLRGAVRRGRRGPGPRPVRRGAQARARHHLHRRDRRHRPAPRGRRARYVANDEREQTLNQLLAEMDGFEPATGIVVLAATNRPEVLDPALLRPGRFDRQVTIPLPNVNERAAILAVHCRGKKLACDVDLNAIARGTPGFSGADLANLVNEAAIVAVRDGRDVLTAADFDAARDRIILGPPGRLQRAAARGEARGGGARVRARPGGRAVRARRPGGQGDDPARGPDARRDRAAAAGRAAHVQRGLPARLARGPARRPGRRAGGDRPGIHRGRQRPGRGDRPGHQDGQGVRPVRDARPDRVPRGRVGVPRRRRSRHVQPPVRRGAPRRKSTARSPGCCARPSNARSSCSRSTAPSSTRWSASCWRRKPWTDPTCTG